jgi:hypothetical protein
LARLLTPAQALFAGGGAGPEDPLEQLVRQNLVMLAVGYQRPERGTEERVVAQVDDGFDCP